MTHSLGSLSRHAGAVALTLLTLEAVAAGQPAAEPSFLDDRGPGVATSLFGTYVAKGEVILYPFFEYYKADNYEYKPEELGAVGDTDYPGRYRASETLFFIAYGITDNLAAEFEMAGIHATLDKAAADQSALPPRIEESGLGDVEAQIRWRWRRETDRRPEIFSYGSVVFPHDADRALTGASGWEFNAGAGVTRGTRWGTWTVRATLEYASASSSPFDLGEYAVEYLKRLSPRWRLYAAIEGTSDELSAIGEIQCHLSRYIFLRFNNGIGLTPKAIDWAPEVGILITLPVRR
jgi:hypothetical protein